MNSIIAYIFSLLWFMLPASIANMAPTFCGRTLKFLAKPLDFNMTYKNKRIFGDNKTIRGLVIGILAGGLVVFFQMILNQIPFFNSISIIDYQSINAVLFGLMMGFGALAGDAAESFFKRQKGIKSGQSWPPYDQIDWLIGTLVFISPIIVLHIKYVLGIFVIFPILHVLFSYLGYTLKLKKDKF